MSGRCSQDGGFVGDCGCTHPNHEHSELVKGLLNAETPEFITEADGEAALLEGFFVDGVDPDGNEYTVGFGHKILDHWNDPRPGHTHDPKDIKARKERLGFAVDTAKHPEKVEKNHQDYQGRTLLFKAYKRFGMSVIADPGNDNRIEAFTFIPKRSDKQRGLGGAGHPSARGLLADRTEFAHVVDKDDTTSADGLQEERQTP